MINNIIDSVVTSSDIFELAITLGAFLAEAKQNPKPQAMFRRLGAQLISWCSAITFDDPIVIKGPATVPLYLENYWQYSKSVKANINRIDTLISEINNSYTPCQQHGITEKTIQNMLDLVNDKYNLYQALLKRGFFQILLLDAQHRSWNSLHSGTVYENGMVRSYIFFTNPHKHTIASNEAIILHEMGHALYTMATQQRFTEPEAYKALFESQSLPLISGQKSELFADCFAMATLYDSPYAELSFWKDIPTNVLEALSIYMKELANTLLADAPAKHYNCAI